MKAISIAGKDYSEMAVNITFFFYEAVHWSTEDTENFSKIVNKAWHSVWKFLLALETLLEWVLVFF